VTTQRVTDVLVVGGGPAGSSAAYWAATAGLNVLLLEREVMPRERVCGDALTPKAAGQLYDMGLEEDTKELHRHFGLRMTARGHSIDLDWPGDHDHPDHGLVIRRSRLDTLLNSNAVRAGAEVWTGVEVKNPIIEYGHLRGCQAVGTGAGTGPEGALEVRAKFVIIADGPISNFGRALGTARSRNYAQGLAIRGYFQCERHMENQLELVFDLRNKSGDELPGYGWVFPVGDGTVNVGVGLLSHHFGNEAISLEDLFEHWVSQIPSHWEINSEHIEDKPLSGRLPMGGSVQPRSGPNWLVVGDAAGSVNPFNGDGVEPALNNGRLAASVISSAIATGDGLELRKYESDLELTYDRYYKLGRIATKTLGRPGLMRKLTLLGIQSRVVTELALRISSNLINNDAGGTESVYQVATQLARLVPDRDK